MHWRWMYGTILDVVPTRQKEVIMLNTIHAVVRDGKIELLEPIALPDGAHVLVTVLTAEEQSFWQQVSESALKQIWDNDEDDVYAQLLTQ
jgi:hypothetical protein